MIRRVKKRSWQLILVVLLGVCVSLFVYFGSDSKDTKEEASFQEFLTSHCKSQQEPYAAIEVKISELPVELPIVDLTRETAVCDFYGRHVFIPLGDEWVSGYGAKRFITISDFDSYHCCEGPSDIEPTGRKIGIYDGIDVYIHTDHWGYGPISGYKPIFVRAIRQLELSSMENIRIVMDRIVISDEEKSLQDLEDEYRVYDSEYAVNVLTPETVENMLNDRYFDSIQEDSVIKKIIFEINTIEAK